MAKKLTLNEIKSKLSEINPTIEITDDTYKGNKVPIKCKCSVCEYEWLAKWNNLSSAKSGCPKCYEKSKYRSDESIIEDIIKNNYTFIKFLTRGTTLQTRILIRCPDNHEYEVSYKTFQDGCRCRKCADIEGAKKRLNNMDKIVSTITSIGFSILNPEDYTGKSSLMQFKCLSGHTFTTSYESLRKTKICPICEYNRESYRYSYENIRECFEKHECILLENEYINNHTKMKFICSCGNKHVKTFNDFINSPRCYECSGQTRWTIELIKELFDDRDLILLSDEYNPYVKLKYICKRGHKAEIFIYDFIQGKNCFQCRNIEKSGENAWNWNHNKTIEERIEGRKYPEYKEWRLSVYERDNFTCQCCGDNKGGNLHAHHLDGHDWAIDKRLDLDNGITLCETCHTDFHNLYGYGDNTREQFEEYMVELMEDNLLLTN